MYLFYRGCLVSDLIGEVRVLASAGNGAEPATSHRSPQGGKRKSAPILRSREPTASTSFDIFEVGCFIDLSDLSKTSQRRHKDGSRIVGVKVFHENRPQSDEQSHVRKAQASQAASMQSTAAWVVQQCPTMSSIQKKASLSKT